MSVATIPPVETLPARMSREEAIRLLKNLSEDQIRAMAPAYQAWIRLARQLY